MQRALERTIEASDPYAEAAARRCIDTLDNVILARGCG
jgi:hypothetical protein